MGSDFCISAQEGQIDFVFSANEPQLPCLFTTCQASQTLKCSENDLWAKNWFWARRKIQIPWYLVSRLRKVVETSFSAHKNRNCHVYIRLIKQHMYPKLFIKWFKGQNLNLGQARDSNSLVSCISAQEGRRNFIFSSKERQLPCLYSTCQALYTLKCSDKD